MGNRPRRHRRVAHPVGRNNVEDGNAVAPGDGGAKVNPKAMFRNRRAISVVRAPTYCSNPLTNTASDTYSSAAVVQLDWLLSVSPPAIKTEPSDNAVAVCW